MKLTLCFSLACALLLAGCGSKPQPKSLAGQDEASSVVLAFMSAVQAENYPVAEKLLHPKADHILSDLEYCHNLFFEKPVSGMAILNTGMVLYGNDWYLAVDLRIRYGELFKTLQFALEPGDSPRLRGVTPIKEE